MTIGQSASRTPRRTATSAVLRVNARLDDERKRKLEYLMRNRRTGVTEVIKAAIDHLYAETKTQGPRKRPNLDSLVGSESGPGDLSTNYKNYLTDSLAKKYGLDG